MKTYHETVNLIAQYNKYKEIKVSPAGTLISVHLIITFASAGVFFAVSGITENRTFGMMSCLTFGFFLWVMTFSIFCERAEKSMPLLRKQYVTKKRIRHLSELPPEQFKKLCIESAGKRTSDADIEDRIIFLFGGKNSYPDNSLEATPGIGPMIVVARQEYADSIKKRYGERISFVLSEKDIADDHPELDYEDENTGKRLKLSEILRKADPWRILRLSFWLFIFGSIGGKYYFYAALFSLVFALTIFATKIRAR